MKTSLFDFSLPESLIATQPANPRDSARLLVVQDTLSDRHVRDLTAYVQPGDVMVFNDTRVLPARLWGQRGQARVEILLHKQLSPGHWSAFAKPAKRLRVGDSVVFATDFHAAVVEKLPSGEVVLDFDYGDEQLRRHLKAHGHMPLPPYIEKLRQADATDAEHYQTVYARHEGSVAAPTAGLHFTQGLLAALDAHGVTRVHITLHVGGGTFLPVKVDDTQDHVMHSEYAEISQEAANTINEAKQRGGKVIAVGTTSLRTLESAADNDGTVHPYHADTSIFITPGYRFKVVDRLWTNFHLPKSTLFMLACAFSGIERTQMAYKHAISNHYRFYSYGDACLLYPAENHL